MVERPLTGEVGSKPVKAPVFVVVPTKGMTLLQRVVAAGEESVEVAVESSQVVFRTANATVLARLIEGHFPPYEDVLPKAHDKKLQVNREAFLGALRRAALLATKDSQAVRFAFGREGLELTARVPEVGESRVAFPLDYPFDALETAFNPQFFADVLRVLGGAEFNLHLKDARSAAVVREDDPAGGTFVYLVMPLSLGA